MPESQGEIDEFEARIIKSEVIEAKREIYDLLLQSAQTVRKIGYYAVSYPIVMSAIWSPEITALETPEKYGAGASAVLASIGVGIISERKRRKLISLARKEAETIVTWSQEEPTIPTPNWAKRAIGIEIE